MLASASSTKNVRVVSLLTCVVNACTSDFAHAQKHTLLVRIDLPADHTQRVVEVSGNFAAFTGAFFAHLHTHTHTLAHALGRACAGGCVSNEADCAEAA